MLIYAILAAVTVLLGFLVSKNYEQLSYGYPRARVLNGVVLFSIFLFLFAVSALRLNVGNDYAKYVEFFHLIRVNLESPTVVPTEPGFNLLFIIIYYLSGRYENYLLMFAVLAFLTILFFIKGMYKQSDWFGMTFFLFMTMGFYFKSFSMVRYYLALALAFMSISYVLKKQWIRFLLLVALGATFHKSMLVVIPLYFLAQWNWKKYQMAIGALICASFFVFREKYLELFLKVYPTYEGTEYLNGGTSYVAIGICLAVLVLSLFLYKKAIKDDRRMKFYFLCNIGGLLLYVCCSFLPSVSRAAYYLTVTQIVFIPSLLKKIENKKIRRLAIFGVIVAFTAYFVLFLIKEAPADGLRILPYQTWLYHDMVPILSDVS